MLKSHDGMSYLCFVSCFGPRCTCLYVGLIYATVHTSVTCSNSSEFMMPSYFTKPFSRHQKFSSIIPNRFYPTFDLGLALVFSLTSLLVLPNYLKLYLANSKLDFNFSFIKTFNSLEALTRSLVMEQPCWTLDLSWSFKEDVLLDVRNKKLFFKTEDRLEHA